MGRDRFGLWASFTVGGVEQRMRWIPPGRFLMGSPEDEPGRWDDEGPRHPEQIPRGFWLADTPCTQALWGAVMGENPSEFSSPKRPVEQVSWEDCQRFCRALEERLPGLGPRLPLEVEWEYACRAGTGAATYAGAMEILGENNAPVLDDIAWYGGNSGHEFDLEKGVNSSDWKEKQYDHAEAGSREVALKAVNPWGLYDMLGNVYEWCDDLWRPRLDAPKEGPGRVLRGGSWGSLARDVRAAYRFRNLPGYRWNDLGFRLARGQGALRDGAEPEGAERPGGEARRGTRRRSRSPRPEAAKQ
jgi:formylglycine-generating enzyme required for sulfatase activity